MSLERFQYDSGKGLTIVVSKHQEHNQSSHGNWANSEFFDLDVALGTFNEEEEYEPLDASDLLDTYEDKYNAIPFLKILHKNRVKNYDDWFKLGVLIYSLDLPCAVWDHLSKQSTKYKAGECQYKWTTFHSKGFTIKSLFHWCKADNPVEYGKLKVWVIDLLLLLQIIYKD
jgi:hypothetical protein